MVDPLAEQREPAVAALAARGRALCDGVGPRPLPPNAQDLLSLYLDKCTAASGLEFHRWLRTSLNGVVVPRYAPNKMPTAVKKRYFELIRSGMKGAAAARVVGVSTSCCSLWFLDAGVVIINAPRPISPRFLTQDDRIAIADGLHAGWSKKQIAAGIGKSFQTVYQLDVLGGGRPAHQQDQSEYLPEDQIQEAQRHGGDHAQPSKTADHRWSATGDRVLEPHRSTPARIVYELAAAMVIPDLRYEMSLDATPAYTLTRWSPPADRDLASVITYESSCGLSVQILFTG